MPHANHSARSATIAVTLASCALVAPALAGNESRARINVLDADRFEVVADYSDNAVYWCGASSHAIRTLRKPTGQPIYVVRGPSPSVAQPGNIAVTFAFSPPDGGAAPSLTNDVDLVGNTMTVGSARQTCFDRLVND